VPGVSRTYFVSKSGTSPSVRTDEEVDGETDGDESGDGLLSL